jgi:hypothetical protein
MLAPSAAGLRVAGPAVAPGFLDQARLVKKLVTLQNLLLVPGRTVEAEGETRPLAAQIGGHAAFGEGLQRRDDDGVDDCGAGFAPIFPGKIDIPVAPQRVGRLEFAGGARQRQIADGNDARAFAGLRQMAAAVAERIELLGIAEIEIGLLAHPGAQAAFQRAMAERIERSEG